MRGAVVLVLALVVSGAGCLVAAAGLVGGSPAALGVAGGALLGFASLLRKGMTDG